MKKALSVILALAICIGMQALPVTAWADGDTTKPTLLSVSISAPADGTAFKPDETMTMTVGATDGEAGTGLSISPTNGSYACFSSASNSILIVKLTPNEGGDENTIKGDLKFYHFSPGLYTLNIVCLRDNAGNEVIYVKDHPYKDDPVLPPEMYKAFNFADPDRTDLEGPVLQSVTIDKNEASVGDIVTFEASATDPSGVQSGCVSIWDNKNYSKQIDFKPVAGNPNLLRGSFAVKPTMPEGNYSISCVMICDGCGNVSSYNETGPSPLPPDARRTIFIHNPGYIPQNSKVTSVQINPSTVKQGEPVTITMTIDPKGNEIDQINLNIMHSIWAGRLTNGAGMLLSKKSEGVYEGTITLPVGWPTGVCIIDGIITFNSERGTYPDWPDSCYINNKLIKPSFTVNPVFNGTANTTVMAGSAEFKPLDGVSASNNTEGDMTGKIEVTGNVDTSKVGVYLIKYKVQSAQIEPNTDKHRYYYDFRWVGVTEVPPDTSSTTEPPIAVTNDTATIGADSSDVGIAKDGNAIAYTNQVSDAGNYDVTYKQNTVATSGLLSTEGAELQPEAVNDGKAGSARLTIDRSGPTLSTSWTKPDSGNLTVTVKASDIAGVAQLKWASGRVSAADFHTGGNAFNDSFSVSGLGEYTLYAQDKLGNESVSPLYLVDGKLCNIGCSAGNLTAPFYYATTNYTLNLDENTANVTITPLKTNAPNIMTIDGRKISSKLVSGILPGKSKTVKVVVYSSNKKVKTTYTVTIRRAASSDTTLKSFTLSRGAILNTGFSNNTSSYKITLPAKTSSLTIKARAASAYAKVLFNGRKASSKTISLKNGMNTTLSITVVAQNGSTRTFNITIERLPKA